MSKDPFYFGDSIAVSNANFLNEKWWDDLGLAFIEGDYEGTEKLTEILPDSRILEPLKKGAEKNDPEALFTLGEYCEFGATFTFYPSSTRVVRIHIVPEYAFAFYKRSAELGNNEAQCAVGNLLLHGSGVQKDIDRAEKYYQMAAENGDYMSQHALGCIEHQRGNQEKAFVWFEKAARKNHLASVFNVARALYNGDGVEQDIVMAYFYFRIAAANEDSEAMELVNKCEEYLNDEQIEDVEKQLESIFDDGKD